MRLHSHLVLPLLAAASLLFTGSFSNVAAAAEHQHSACDVWTEEVIVGPRSKAWQRDDLTAHRKALRRPSKKLAQARNARMLDYELKDVSTVVSKSRPGTHNLFNTKSTFVITFQQLPCKSKPGVQ